MNVLNDPADAVEYCRYAAQHFPALCRPRPQDGHKGTFGTLAVVGGAAGMIGAPLLAGTAALYSGSGKVMVGFSQSTLPLPVFAPCPELMLDTAEHLLQRRDIGTWVAGCGLGRDEAAVRVLHTVWHGCCTQLVLDADALRLLADHSRLFPPKPRDALVLTPHPGEAAHLLGMSITQVQQNRTQSACELASRHRCWVILKGHGTVICSPSGETRINPTGNVGLATAGSGDVLAGIVGSLMGQGIAVEEAVPAAAWLHGAASELLSRHQNGPIGMLAGEIAPAVRRLRNCLTGG